MGSRRNCENFIIAGRIKIKGVVAALSDTVDFDSSQVTFDGKVIKPKKLVYYAFNKPVGVVCSSVRQSGDKIVLDYFDQKDLTICGRLDKDSEGLVLLTNDGDFANFVMHPRYDHEKEYVVHVRSKSNNPSEAFTYAMKLFKCGHLIKGKKTRPAEIFLQAQSGNKAKFKIILRQGMNRQIRRTFEKSLIVVESLQRTRINSICLGDLECGHIEKLTKANISTIINTRLSSSERK
jgi:23S rRNA pseudouridine2605 synthase